jgi:hypothetical protein
VHCRECTIRRGITQVHDSGKALRHVPAWLESESGRMELTLSITAEQGLVKVVVETMRPAAAIAGDDGPACPLPAQARRRTPRPGRNTRH